MEFVQGLDWSNFIPQLGEHTVAFFCMLAMTYAFLWIVVPIFSKHYDKVNLPLGIKLERDRGVDDVLRQASSDAVVVQGIYETGERLEHQAREQMRRVMISVVRRYLDDNVDNKPYQEYLLRSKLTFSNIISENHIVYSLSQNRVREYVENKQVQVVDSIGVNISQDANAIFMLHGLTKEFIGQILPVQKKLCSEKIASYKRAFQLLQLEGNRALCQAKIEKNENYLVSMGELENTYEYQSVLLRQPNLSNELGGATLIEDSVNKTLKVLGQLEEEGRLGTTTSKENAAKQGVHKLT